MAEQIYNKWKSRRWMICFYWMIITAGVLFGTKITSIGVSVQYAVIAAATAYFLLFTGYETYRKVQAAKNA